MVKKNMGRQKIQMRKMSKESNLQVTFSKRRFGLFKKASELCTLCGAKILMIVFSPGGKVFSFGHPNVKDLIRRFSNPNNDFLFLEHNNLELVDARPNIFIQCLNDKFTEVLAKQEEERNKKKELEALRETRGKRGIYWYENDVKELDLGQTNHLISALQDVRNKLASEISQNSHMNVSQNYFGESSGGGNIEVGQDLNGFTNNPNIIFPNYGSSFGYGNYGSSFGYGNYGYNFNNQN